MADDKYVETFRLINEPDNHWKARKTFIMRNWDDYPEEMQLISLSMVWANMTFDGCKYCPELMDRVRDMAAGVGDTSSTVGLARGSSCQEKDRVGNQGLKRIKGESTEPRSKRQRLAEDTNTSSVSASQNESCLQQGSIQNQTSGRLTAKDITGSIECIDGGVPLITVYPSCSKSAAATKEEYDKLGSFCGAFKAKCKGLQTSDDQLRQLLLNLLYSSGTNYAFDYMLTEDTSGQWQAKLVVSSVLCGVCRSSTKKAAKQNLLNSFAHSLIENHTIVIQEGLPLDPKLGCSSKIWYDPCYSNQSPEGVKACKALTTEPQSETLQTESNTISATSILEQLPHDVRTNDLNRVIAPAPRIPGFFLYETMEDGSNHTPIENPICKIMNSASVSKLHADFQTEEYPRPKNSSAVLCTVYISSRRVGVGLALNVREAKHLAAHNALRALEMTHVTLRKTSATDGEAVGRSQLTDDSNQETSIAESNVGHKLLKMMGWKGEGGLGKTGEGIAVPVKATGNDSSSKAGLGFDLAQLKDPDTKQLDNGKTWQFLQAYASSTNDEDLVFSKDFSINERKVVHGMALKLGLKTKSRGKGDDRYMTVSRKWDVHRLVQALAEKGGRIGNYELVQPSLGGSFVPAV
ncbi:uncharacterized protein [Diadema setosum]|uniref:uncharacterized protein n=1 Tax=Diadema setosum TaxID=31175 RepID=UPI003B3ADF58